MSTWNIYSGNRLLNTYPLSDASIEKMKKNKMIVHVDPYTKEKQTIPVRSCRIVRCINL